MERYKRKLNEEKFNSIEELFNLLYLKLDKKFGTISFSLKYGDVGDGMIKGSYELIQYTREDAFSIQIRGGQGRLGINIDKKDLPYIEVFVTNKDITLRNKKYSMVTILKY